ncbi:DEAD/DEAH box helicase [Parachlamydia sp. AcF125]|uniref:DEAD/DEAH box helicase n=1 Tax=Parachlamydia sp. AcF125 TaxID=2795736 RepID=UPI001BC947E4|nr:DEAD/DEAH box helicase [Parachlamydia sp. AcF125]MBS4169098.1 Protein translocase subunit SecA [Parachlamydia sp. AcF125]
MTNSIQCIVKGFWIDLPTGESTCEDDVVQLAHKINTQIYNRSRDSHTYGFAKAICRDIDQSATRWQVRSLQVEMRKTPDTPHAKEFNGIKKAYPQAEQESINLPRKGGFSPLIKAVREVVHAIEANSEDILKPHEIERKLRKLIIYLLLAPSWPYKNEGNSIDKVCAVFNYYKQLFGSKDLTPYNQAAFNKFVSELNKHLHQHAMTLDVLSDKIVTKTHRSLPEGLRLFDQVKDLIRKGTERILGAVKPDNRAVRQFCRVFSTHAYIYKPNADNAEARLQLQRSVDRLVELLIAYDRQNDSLILFNFMNGLMQAIQNLLHSNAPMDLSRLSSLVWTFRALVCNAGFIQYMRPAGKEQNLSEPVRQLFSHEQTWRPTGKYVVLLGNAELFREMLTARIDERKRVCTLSEGQINLIFRNLNFKLASEEDVTYRNSYKRMYLLFLHQLAAANKLHFLKPYANHRDYLVRLRENLIRLDYSFMEVSAKVPLDAFFGNAAFIALHFQKIPHGVHVRRTLVNLFAKLGENPVKSKREFEKLVLQAIEDFYQEWEILGEEVLSQIGRSAAPLRIEETARKELVPVESWLAKTVIPLYHSLKLYILKCLPLKWKEATFNGAENLLQRLCWHEGNFYVIDYQEGKYVFHDPFNKTFLPECPDTVLYSDLFSNVKTHLQHELRVQAHREAVSFLTEAYMSFNHDQKIKKMLEEFLSIVFKKMQGTSSATFQERIRIVASFLQVMSPFFKKLDHIVQARFFKDGKLRVNIALNLVKQAKPYGEVAQILENLRETLKNLEEGEDVALKGSVVKGISQLVAFLCAQDIRDILKRCSLNQLVEVTSQFENVICRKMDELSYSKEDFIHSFCAHEGNKSQSLDNDLRAIMGDLAIKETIIHEFGDFLRTRPIPVHFILPNQALALQLCMCEEFKDQNLLIRLGTGQGKSIVIAVAALHEARRIKDVANGRVFVFTSYDHLARRDHELGENFFKKEGIKSLCISTIHDVSRFNNQVKIIYADIENIDSIVREIMVRLLENRASPAEKAFIKTIYENSAEDRIILDEYDLLLYDLERKRPFVETIPPNLLNVNFVRSNQDYWPWLAEQTGKGGKGTTSHATDRSTGKDYCTVPFYSASSGFNLYISIMRLSKLIKRAKRVIGLSGTALQGESHNLSNPLYFEIPSSQNPEVFGTKIQEENALTPADQACIACHQKKQFDSISGELSNLVIDPATIQEYCQTIVRDIQEIRQRKQKDAIAYERPILIFGDPYLEYTTPENMQLKKQLWKTLKEAIIAAGIPLSELTTDVSDADLQKIARSGKVTMTTIKYGRGADIRVSLDIEEGLHVIVSVPVIHKRLLQQLIGRTGRMGRQGSYSAITFGSLVETTADEPFPSSEFFGALHEVTRFFVNKLTSAGTYNAEDSKRWLMFLSNAYVRRKIHKDHAQRLCGAFFEPNPELDKFYS